MQIFIILGEHWFYVRNYIVYFICFLENKMYKYV